jgi:hypothetical protein
LAASDIEVSSRLIADDRKYVATDEGRKEAGTNMPYMVDQRRSRDGVVVTGTMIEHA